MKIPLPDFAADKFWIEYFAKHPEKGVLKEMNELREHYQSSESPEQFANRIYEESGRDLSGL